MQRFHLSLVAAVLLGTAGPVHGQAEAGRATGLACAPGDRFRLDGLAGPGAELLRAAELLGAAPPAGNLIGRRSSRREVRLCAGASLPWPTSPADESDGSGVTIEALDAELRDIYRSGYPDDRNNGALWAGRGLTTAVRGGVALEWGPVSAALAPSVIFQENRDFEFVPATLAGHSPLIYTWHNGFLDWPQRMGEEAFWTLDAGQSYVRVDAYGVAAGISTENLWWGPGQRNAILLSNTAPGFVHAFAGTARPIDVGIGTLEGEVIWGRLRESDYFDDDGGNDHTFLSGIVAAFRPDGVPGLTVGAAELYELRVPPEGLSVFDYAAGPVTLPLSIRLGEQANTTEGNGLAALFARWAFAPAGLEVYAEWAREDYPLNPRDFAAEPDHAQAYTLGFQKVIPRGLRWFRVYGELTHLGSATTFRSGRFRIVHYTHAIVRQGHTHRGQLLGAGIGPGADAQTLGVDVFGARGKLGLFAERIRRDVDAYYALWGTRDGYRGHDVELTGGLTGTLLGQGWSAHAALAYSARHGRGFVAAAAPRTPGDPDYDFGTDSNWRLELTTRWTPLAQARASR